MKLEYNYLVIKDEKKVSFYDNAKQLEKVGTKSHFRAW